MFAAIMSRKSKAISLYLKSMQQCLKKAGISDGARIGYKSGKGGRKIKQHVRTNSLGSKYDRIFFPAHIASYIMIQS